MLTQRGQRERLRLWGPAIAALLAACASPVKDGAGSATPQASATSSASAQGALPPLTILHDDVPSALARAQAEAKVLFVDAWAPWCHTCLSMQSFVLSDPSLRSFADRIVFAAIDTDRAENAAFLEKHAVGVWPTFFLIDPETEKVVGVWTGSASLAEMRSFLEDGVAVVMASRAEGLPPNDVRRLLSDAGAALAAGAYDRAEGLFGRASEAMPADHPRKTDALMGRMFALYRAKRWDACVASGRRDLPLVRGAARPADFASYLLACAEHLPDADAAPARTEAIAALRKLLEAPPPDASADDRADAWGILAEALEQSGDVAGQKKALENKLAVLVDAAKSAPTPEAAATFDYGFATTYVALGQPDRAVTLLTNREKEFPNSYEPPGRLADVLAKMGRNDEALAAAERTIARAYGPRKLRYMKLRAELLAKLGRRDAQIEALRAEVAGYEALPAGQASPDRLADARRRLAEAEGKSP